MQVSELPQVSPVSVQESVKLFLMAKLFQPLAESVLMPPPLPPLPQDLMVMETNCPMRWSLLLKRILSPMTRIMTE